MAGAFSLPTDYWLSLQITPQDVENLHTFLFERETPLTARDLAIEFIDSRIKKEKAVAESKRKTGGKNFLPKEKYQVGDELVFPALEWSRGTVAGVRSGVNPALNEFDVLTVTMEDSSVRLFSSNLVSHYLNDAPVVAP